MGSITPCAPEQNIAYLRVGLENLLNFVDEDVLTEELSTEQLGRENTEVSEEGDQDIVTEGVDDEESLTVRQEFQHLAQARASFRKAWEAR